jgi:hypothetical protein
MLFIGQSNLRKEGRYKISSTSISTSRSTNSKQPTNNGGSGGCTTNNGGSGGCTTNNGGNGGCTTNNGGNGGCTTNNGGGTNQPVEMV